MSHRIASCEDDLQSLCHGHARFTDGSPDHAFAVQGERISLRHHPDVFPPSAFGLKFADHVDFSGCNRVADIGTGTGLLAILAALKGARHIKATDVSGPAIELAAKNARQMHVADQIDFQQGHFFGTFTGVFDLITANLPQEILPPAYHDSLNHLQCQAIDGGGSGGNDILLDFLDVAPLYMHSQTRLYIIVNTITDYRKTLQKIESRYHADLIWQGITGTKNFVAENIDYYRPMMEATTISLSADAAGNWRAQQFIYCLALRS